MKVFMSRGLAASLFVTTYEMPQHLALVCAGIQRQSVQNFEVLFCDDGSGLETQAVIQEFQKKTTLPSQHIWQEHHGFRKCRILNQAFRQSSGEVSIFLDGDCIPHRYFVQDHLEQQEPGYYLAGRRVELGEEFSAQLTAHQVAQGYFDQPRLSLLWAALHQKIHYFNRSFRIPSQKLRRFLGMHQVIDLKGCNYSVHRSAIEAINGFDEAYEGYGREDTDVELRFKNLGLHIKSLKGLALQFHIWHPRRAFTPQNDHLLEEVKKTKRIQAQRGFRSEG